MGNFLLFHGKSTIKFTENKQVPCLLSGDQETLWRKMEREEFTFRMCQSLLVGNLKILRVRKH